MFILHMYFDTISEALGHINLLGDVRFNQDRLKILQLTFSHFVIMCLNPYQRYENNS